MAGPPPARLGPSNLAAAQPGTGARTSPKPLRHDGWSLGMHSSQPSSVKNVRPLLPPPSLAPFSTLGRLLPFSPIHSSFLFLFFAVPSIPTPDVGHCLRDICDSAVAGFPHAAAPFSFSPPLGQVARARGAAGRVKKVRRAATLAAAFLDGVR